MMQRFPILILAGTLAATLTGCTVGPDFTPPSAPAPAAGYAATAGVSMGGGPEGAWWQAFGSPELDALVTRALANNQSLAASDATLARARDQVTAVAGRALPQISGNARAEREEVNFAAFGFDPASFGGGGGGAIANPIFNLYTVGGGISFDPDLWGRNRRALEQARAGAEAEAYQAEAAHLTVAGRVVIQYFTIAAIRERIAAEQALIGESRRTVALTQARQQAGEGTMVDVLSGRAQLAADQQDIPALNQQLAEARGMMAVLLGISPAELGASDYRLTDLTLPDVPVALPSALIHKRPDILTAQARLHGAVAAVGVATANLFPNIALGATYGQASTGIGNLLSSSFRSFDLASALTAPIYDGGTLRAQKRGAEAEVRAAEATYRQTVLEAFAQVSTLIAGIENDAAALANARESAALAGQSLGLSRKSFQVGNTGVLQVLDANRTNQRAQLVLLDARSRQFLSVARLYVATAGGWHDAGPAAP